MPGLVQEKLVCPVNRQYGLDLLHLGPPRVVIYLMTDVGSVGGGWLSSWLLKRGWTVNAARKAAVCRPHRPHTAKATSGEDAGHLRHQLFQAPLDASFQRHLRHRTAPAGPSQFHLHDAVFRYVQQLDIAAVGL
jgi:predicted alpha/beta-fold hydrolase